MQDELSLLMQTLMTELVKNQIWLLNFEIVIEKESLLKKLITTLLSYKKCDDYGYCNQCGEEIGLNRLQARPTATLCIDCKTLDEIREKQMAK